MKIINTVIIFLVALTILNSCTKKLQAVKSYSLGFDILKIDTELQNNLRQKGVFNDSSPVQISRLRLLKIKYYDFDLKEHNGEIIVLDGCSQEVLYIFEELFNSKFPIDKMNLMTQYSGNDSISMADNNTSAHNLRLVTGGKRILLHAYGTAIDLNPLINPFVTIDTSMGIAKYNPIAGVNYANRKPIRLGKTNRTGMAEDAINIFARHGFYYWGGYWDTPIDYQHFQISRSLTEILVMMDFETATKFFEQVVCFYNKNQIPIENKIEEKKNDLGFTKKSLSEFYYDNPKLFQDVLKQIISHKDN